MTLPEVGACRRLSPVSIRAASNETPTVDCGQTHTAQTFVVAGFPARFERTAYDDSGLGKYVYDRCGSRFAKFLGGGESMAMRSLLSWAWFRPTEKDWAAGARWYRCDVVGGPEGAQAFRPLPRTTKGFLGGRPPEQWMTCASGARFSDATRVPCADAHDWRAVASVRVGEDKEKTYPGDSVVQNISRNYCSDWVGAYLSYPVKDYDYGITVFRRADWEAGNRLSICWARTPR